MCRLKLFSVSVFFHWDSAAHLKDTVSHLTNQSSLSECDCAVNEALPPRSPDKDQKDPITLQYVDIIYTYF